jgi:hypothetical protein
LRTKQTVEPLASTLGIQPRVAPDSAALAQQILSGDAAAVVLVAAHSNTVPEIITALGASVALDIIGHRDFDNLFLVTTHPGGGASMLRLKYGTRST